MPGGRLPVLQICEEHMSVKEHVSVKLTQEAINCLKFWQEHHMYGGSLSDVIVEQMEEWLCRGMGRATYKEIKEELERIKREGP